MIPTVLYALLILLVIYLWFRRNNTKYPPCPIRPWPIIGHLLLLDKNPREQFKKFRQQCGDIYSLYLGRTHAVILNGYDIIKEAFITQGDDFSYRSEAFLSMASMGAGIANSNGDVFKEQQTTTLNILRNIGLSKNNLEERVQGEIRHFMELLEGLKGQPIDIHHYTMVSASNIICSIVIGKRFDYGEQRLVKLVDLLSYSLAHLKGTSVLRYFSFLRFLPGDVFKLKIIKRNLEELVNIFADVYGQEKEDVIGEPGDYFTAYMQDMNEKLQSGKLTYLSKPNLMKCIFDLFAAGTESTANTIVWFLLYMINYPQVQEKVFREIEAVVGLDRIPTLNDRTKMNYVTAVIMEIQRLVSMVPMTLPRILMRDIQLKGFLLPKGTNIMASLDSILYDKAVWGEDAEQFRPERFISRDGSLIYPESWVPFSFGRRMCIGKNMAMVTLYLFVTSIIQRFEILPADPSKIPPLNGKYGFTYTPESFHLRTVHRVS